MPISTMMDDYQLTLKPIFEFGRQVHADKKIITFTGDGYVESTFAQVADRADQLAAALTKLGVQQGDRVGTFLWNNQTHMEAYLAIPVMGRIAAGTPISAIQSRSHTITLPPARGMMGLAPAPASSPAST